MQAARLATALILSLSITASVAGNCQNTPASLVLSLFRQKAESTLDIQLVYLDASTGDIGLDYDSADTRAPFNEAYGNSSLTIHRINSGH